MLLTFSSSGFCTYDSMVRVQNSDAQVAKVAIASDLDFYALFEVRTFRNSSGQTLEP